MRLGELDIPDEVLDARDRGDLLIFAGAGVSMGGSARYPDFGGLVRRIGANAGHALRRNESFDRYLGRLEDAGVDIHRAAQHMLTDPSSTPNTIHDDIIRLFRDQHSVRLVTTNFDQHFSTVAQARFAAGTSIYAAPALPLGNAFSGIIYVHGSVVGVPERLVLTDTDFGKAYSTEGWARVFLQEAFKRYTVLFIGYSHNDPPLIYLTRGLTPEARRLFAITPEGEKSHWRYLRIQPVGYRLRRDGEHHSALAEGIHAWANYVEMSTLAHRTHIKSLLSKQASEVTEGDESYLRRCFRQLHLLRYFYDEGLRLDWLMWAEKAGLLAPAFSPSPPETVKYAEQVAQWFARHAVLNHQDAMAVFMQAHVAMPEHLWSNIGFAYFRERKKPQPGRAKWVAQLCMHWRSSYSTDVLEYAMVAAAESGDYKTAILLLEFLSTPRIVHERGSGAYSNPPQPNDTSAHVKITATHGTHWFKELWEKHLRPKLDVYATRLVEMATDKLGQAYELQAVHAAAAEPFDEVNFSRSAIETHEQDNDGDQFHILVDIARDSFGHLIKVNRPLAQAIQVRWIHARSPLLRRLAVHGMQLDSMVSADKKLRWIMDLDLMAPYGLHHEVFMLIRDAFPHASTTVQKHFLEYVRKDTLRDVASKSKEDAGAYWHSEFTLLDTLNKVMDGGHRGVQARLASIKRKYPRFRPSDHPGFGHWHEMSDGPESPITETQLRAKPLRVAVRYLITYKGRHWWGERRDALMSIVRSVVKGDPAWGLAIAALLAKRKRLPDDIWPEIVWGWQDAVLIPDDWHAVLKMLGGIPLRTTGQSIAQLLRRGIEATTDGIPEFEWKRAERLAASVMENARREEKTIVVDRNWYSVCGHQTGGILAQFNLVLLSKQRETTPVKWKGLPPLFKDAFARMIHGESNADQEARTILASHFRFLYFTDPKWTIKRLLPLFDWRRDEKTALQIWLGYLGRGQWNKRYLTQLLPFYEQSIERIGGVLKEHEKRVAEHVASICLLSGSRRARSTLLVSFFKIASEEGRVHFAETIGSELRHAPEPKRHGLWREWLKGYWQDRSLGKPAQLLAKELGTMIRWLPLLTEDFPDAVDVLEKTRVTEGSFMFNIYELEKSCMATKYPSATARYILYLLRNHRNDYANTKDVMEVVVQLVQHKETHSLLAEIVENLASKGYIEDAEKLNGILEAENHVPAGVPE